ncbi:ectonucleoside triphosphate diphosphohydrolase 8-like [Mantella aurantiaca]
MQCRNRKGLAVGCLIVISTVSGIIALILSLVDIQNVYQPSPNKYGIVFDAGSSHTSLYIYQWPAHKENDTGIVSQIHMCEVPGSGLSSYADHPAEAREVLKSCMDQALSVIPSQQHKETTVLLGATAGMRLLNLQNETKTQLIFNAVSETLRQYPVDFQGARILDGAEEGSLGWITVNYLLGTFIQQSYISSWIHPQQAQMFGAMDLGGASTQMTFQPSGDIEDKTTEMVFRLYGFDYRIYTHSYLCYGQDQALKRLLVNRIENTVSGNVTHPCYPKGYTANVNLSSVYNSPCVLSAPPDIGTIITVEGTGDPTECNKAIKHIFNFSEYSNTSFNGIYQPPVHGKFYAFSAFYYTFNFLNLTYGQSLSMTNNSVWEFCMREWKELVANFPGEKSNRLLDYCNSAMYILTLLVQGYKFNSGTWNNIHFAKQAGNADVGWTLGYMLNMTNKIPSEGPSLLKAHSYNLWVAAIFFIVLSLAAGLIAAPLHCYFRKACSGQGGWT